jgi:hypothetical protein
MLLQRLAQDRVVALDVYLRAFSAGTFGGGGGVGVPMKFSRIKRPRLTAALKDGVDLSEGLLKPLGHPAKNALKFLFS